MVYNQSVQSQKAVINSVKVRTCQLLFSVSHYQQKSVSQMHQDC